MRRYGFPACVCQKSDAVIIDGKTTGFFRDESGQLHARVNKEKGGEEIHAVGDLLINALPKTRRNAFVNDLLKKKYY